MLDSNNLAQYLELWRTGGRTRYENAAFDAELDAAHAAIASGDIDGYETHLVAAHNILVADLPSFPVYYF
jgi:ABC-type oligopeptide transport system substrate-binding subunit